MNRPDKNPAENLTGAAKVDMISHSMGVTLGRKVVQGGAIQQKDGTTCDIGPNIKDKVRL